MITENEIIEILTKEIDYIVEYYGKNNFKGVPDKINVYSDLISRQIMYKYIAKAILDKIKEKENTVWDLDRPVEDKDVRT